MEQVSRWSELGRYWMLKVISYIFVESPTVVRVNMFIRSISKIDDVAMVSIYLMINWWDIYLIKDKSFKFSKLQKFIYNQCKKFHYSFSRAKTFDNSNIIYTLLEGLCEHVKRGGRMKGKCNDYP